MITEEDVMYVADLLHFNPTSNEIALVIKGYEDEAHNDSTGEMILWIENLLYNLNVKKI